MSVLSSSNCQIQKSYINRVRKYKSPNLKIQFNFYLQVVKNKSKQSILLLGPQKQAQGSDTCMPPKQDLKNVPSHIPQTSENARPNSTKSHHTLPNKCANTNYNDPRIGLRPARGFLTFPNPEGAFPGSWRAHEKGGIR